MPCIIYRLYKIQYPQPLIQVIYHYTKCIVLYIIDNFGLVVPVLDISPTCIINASVYYMYTIIMDVLTIESTRTPKKRHVK